LSLRSLAPNGTGTARRVLEQLEARGKPLRLGVQTEEAVSQGVLWRGFWLSVERFWGFLAVGRWKRCFRGAQKRVEILG